MPLYYAQLGDLEYAFDILDKGGATIIVPISPEGNSGEQLRVDLASVHSNVATGEGLYSLLVDDRSYQFYVEKADEGYRVLIWRHRFAVRVLTEREWRLQKVAPKQGAHSGALVINAPMPGLVKAIPIEEGSDVASGARLVVLEAMKMENDIVAPRAGRVRQVHVQPGTVVEGGKPLVTLE
jgi:biotin carboxyl carrier protein